MMYRKFLGLSQDSDEPSILQTLLDHAEIDWEELVILEQMMEALVHEGANRDLDAMHQQIQSINRDNAKVFETVTDHIIQSNFDFQKQSDLLRLQQRIDGVSGLIIGTSRRIVMANNIHIVIPPVFHEPLRAMMALVKQSQTTFIEAMKTFQSSRRDVIQLIHRAEEQENTMNTVQSDMLELVYKTANTTDIKMGDGLVIVAIVDYVQRISSAIKNAATGLDWLLLNH